MDAALEKTARDDVLKLEQLLASSSDGTEEDRVEVWVKAANILDALAGGLRDPAMREPTGETGICEILSSILALTIKLIEAKSDPLPLMLLNEAGRVASNLAADCDANRDRLVAAEYPQRAVQLLRLREDVLRITSLRPLVGSLFNLSLDGHAGVAQALSGRDKLITLLETAAELYQPHEWTDDGVHCTLAVWLWNTASHTVSKDIPPTYPLSESDIDVLLAPLNNNWPSEAPHESGIDIDAAIDTDIPIVTAAAHLLDVFSEAEQLDATTTKQLKRMSDFIDDGELPTWVQFDTEEDLQEVMKVFTQAKGKVAYAFIAILGERQELSQEILETLNAWLGNDDRADLRSLALLTYGNYARDDKRNEQLVSGPASLLPQVLPLLDPASPVDVQHSVIGLVRNLAIPSANWRPLGDAGVITKVVAMKPWADTRDMLGSIQGQAMGIIKQLVRDVDNAEQFLSLHDGVDALIALGKRTDDPPLALEATRIWVNCMRSLSAAKKGPGEAWTTLSDPGIVETVVKLLTAGQKHPILVNESLVGMVYLATIASLRDEVAALLVEEQNLQVEEGAEAAAAGADRRGVDVLAGIIAPLEGTTYGPELQANAVTLVKELNVDAVTLVVKKAVALAVEEKRTPAFGAADI